MRRLILTLVVVACSGDRQAAPGTASSPPGLGPDHVVLRIPRSGGTARAYLYPRLDSVVWAAAGAPAIARVLAFDPDAGLIALVDAKGHPRRVDLRLGEIRFASRAPLTSIVSSNGSDIYGVSAGGSVIRMTPTGDWKFDPPSPAKWVFPEAGGLLVIAATHPASTKLWSIRAPDDRILDSSSLPALNRGIRTQAGDRLYLAVDGGLASVATRDLSRLTDVRFEQSIVAVSPTPSGDRLYVAVRGSNRISVVNRYSQSIVGSIDLPEPVSELRMDPLGQQILARPAAAGGSAWVIAIGSSRPAGSIITAWTEDLPAFAPSSTIATSRGKDVVFVNANTLEDVKTIANGAIDFWYFFSWNGFRPRSANLDQPVTFGKNDTVIVQDSPGIVPADSGIPSPPIRDTLPSMIVPPAAYPQPARPRYMVSFAAVLTELRAKEVAGAIEVNGIRPHIVLSQTGTTTLYRVVLGPYGSREEAERIGRDSGRQHWVYEAPQ